jgi:TetR/AcrR family transcriptional regulator
MNKMFAKFLNLALDKQEKILEAAISEFADKGFDRASTNEIVKKAGISKGILFHYFKSKKNLFLYVYDYSSNLCMDEIFEKVDHGQNDIFMKLRQVYSFKLEILNKYPSIFKYLERAVGEESNEVKSEIEERNKKLSKSSYSKIFNNIDITKFRDGVDINRVINIITWTLEGLGTSERQKAKASETNQINYEKISGEIDIYVEMLRSCLYK